MSYAHFRFKRLAALSCLLLPATGTVLAGEEINALHRQIQHMLLLQQNQEQQIKELEHHLRHLEEDASDASTDNSGLLSSSTTTTSDSFQIGLSGLFSVGDSSIDNDTLEGLQAGAHDPKQNGFTVQNVELSMGGAVDTHFDAQTNIIFQIDANGEIVVELEEAVFTTRNLPWGLQVKGGQYFT